jgi:glycosyltransferase involved in cell wall biosynthesis
MQPLVSILIPAYNAEQWIGDTIQSALAQTWPRKEIIVVDDGSSDGTLSVARRFASNEVTVMTQHNQGAAAARNRAFAICQGDYIQWLDADDCLATDKIALQMERVQLGLSNRTLLASAWGTFTFRIASAVFSPTALWCDLHPAEWMLRSMSQNLYMLCMSWLVSRNLCELAGAWDTRLSLDDDGEYFSRVIMASDLVLFVPEAKAYYRRLGNGNLSNLDRSNKKWESQFLSIQLHVAYLRSLNDGEVGRAACLNYLKDWSPFFYPERQDLFEKMQQLAVEANGRLETPKLPWKYAWIQKLFGWDTAKRMQMLLPMVRWSIVQQWDRMLFNVEKRTAFKGGFGDGPKAFSTV